MVKQNPGHPSVKQQNVRGNSGLSSLWITCGDVRNSCSDNTQQYFGFVAGARPGTFQECTANNDDDDDDSIVEQEKLHNQQQRIHRLPQQPLPAPLRVRGIVDGFIAPFIQCVQPPIHACMTHTDSWDSAMDATGDAQMRGRNVNYHSPSFDQPKRGVECDLNHQGANQRGSAHISPNDVLCGRGNSVNKHIGNVRFRELVAANKDDYRILTKKEKMIRAREIVDLILYHTDPPGRFVARDAETGLWQDVGMPRSLEKTSQALREKSASDRTVDIEAGINNIRRMASSDGNDADDVEVTATAQSEESKTSSPSIATTITVSKHRNGKSLPPPIIVPDHLRKFYKKEPIHRLTPLPTVQPIISPKRAAHLQWQQQLHAVNSGLAPNPSCQLDNRGTVPMRSSEKIQSHFVPAPPPIAMSLPSYQVKTTPISPKQSSIKQRPPSSQSAVVTPLGKNSSHQISPSHAMNLKDDQCISPIIEMKEKPQPQRAIWNYDVEVHGPKSPIFPSDVFQNPSYDTKVRNTPNETSIRWKELLHDENPDAISPSRKQSYPKRQRMSKNLLDVSFDASFLDVDTSMESIETAVDNLTNIDDAVTTAHDNVATGNINTTGTGTTHRLVEAIGAQLTLDDKTIRSPSELVQTFTRGRSRRMVEPLPRPSKATGPLNISADSMDGLAALSTAAFLRLDESF